MAGEGSEGVRGRKGGWPWCVAGGTNGRRGERGGVEVDVEKVQAWKEKSKASPRCASLCPRRARRQRGSNAQETWLALRRPRHDRSQAHNNRDPLPSRLLSSLPFLAMFAFATVSLVALAATASAQFSGPTSPDATTVCRVGQACKTTWTADTTSVLPAALSPFFSLLPRSPSSLAPR